MHLRHIEEKQGSIHTPVLVWASFCSYQFTQLSTSILIKQEMLGTCSRAWILIVHAAHSWLSMLRIPSLCCRLPWPPSSRSSLLLRRWGDRLALSRRHICFLVAHSCVARNLALLVKNKKPLALQSHSPYMQHSHFSVIFYRGWICFLHGYDVLWTHTSPKVPPSC